MRAGDLLRRLDSQLLPYLARAVARLEQAPPRPRVLTGTALLSVLAVVATAFWTAGPHAAGNAAGDADVTVGVRAGDWIPGYVQASKEELSRLLAAPASAPPPGETYALVTLKEYWEPDRLTPILAGASVSAVLARVWLGDAQTEIVRIPALRTPADVAGAMALVAERKEREARRYLSLRGAVTGDGDEERQLRALYERGARVALAEAAAYRSACRCVYAAVVRATPAALDKVAERSEVRAVDPAPEVRRLDRAVFQPPLPEQEDVVPPAVSLPSGAPSASGPPSMSSVASTPPPAGTPAPTSAPTTPGKKGGGGKPPEPSSTPPTTGAPATGPTSPSPNAS